MMLNQLNINFNLFKVYLKSKEQEKKLCKVVHANNRCSSVEFIHEDDDYKDYLGMNLNAERYRSINQSNRKRQSDEESIKLQ